MMNFMNYRDSLSWVKTKPSPLLFQCILLHVILRVSLLYPHKKIKKEEEYQSFLTLSLSIFLSLFYLMTTPTTTTTTKNRLLPAWVLKLIGFSSLASALIGFAIYWFKKYPSRRRITREPTNEVKKIGFFC